MVSRRNDFSLFAYDSYQLISKDSKRGHLIGLTAYIKRAIMVGDFPESFTLSNPLKHKATLLQMSDVQTYNEVWSEPNESATPDCWAQSLSGSFEILVPDADQPEHNNNFIISMTIGAEARL